MLVLFFVVAGVPSILFFRSMIGTLWAGQPETASLDATIPGGLPRACADRAETLRREISDHFDGLRAMASTHGSSGLRRWRVYSVAFGGRVDAAREECRADPETLEQTAHLFDALDELARVATAVATRLLTDDGDTLARIEKIFAEARRP